MSRCSQISLQIHRHTHTWREREKERKWMRNEYSGRFYKEETGFTKKNTCTASLMASCERPNNVSPSSVMICLCQKPETLFSWHIFWSSLTKCHRSYIPTTGHSQREGGTWQYTLLDNIHCCFRSKQNQKKTKGKTNICLSNPILSLRK